MSAARLGDRRACPAGVSRTPIDLGLLLVAICLLRPWTGEPQFGRLPRDIVLERE